ncbi:MAG: hypothetical protein ABFD04_05535 [Syntrophomonas sp.]
MAGKKENRTDKEILELIKHHPANKALALSFAVALVFANVADTTTTLAADPKNMSKQNQVLEKEKEKDAKDAEREWEQDEEQGYSYYNTGSGYYYRPWMYTGSSYNSRRATWGSSTTTKKSSVGGYSISKGGATG